MRPGEVRPSRRPPPCWSRHPQHSAEPRQGRVAASAAAIVLESKDKGFSPTLDGNFVFFSPFETEFKRESMGTRQPSLVAAVPPISPVNTSA